MPEVKYTLLTEGTSDKALIPIINWIFRQQRNDLAVNSDWSDPSQSFTKPHGLLNKIRYSLDFYPCDILFVHRDSDNKLPENRHKEITEAFDKCKSNLPLICVVPVKMVEAWLLFDETAIRDSVGNPNGKVQLDLPKISQLEALTNPKEVLRNALTTASELTGRRKKDFGNAEMLVQLSQLIEDYSPLRQLSAFQRLEKEIKAYIATI